MIPACDATPYTPSTRSSQHQYDGRDQALELFKTGFDRVALAKFVVSVADCYSLKEETVMPPRAPKPHYSVRAKTILLGDSGTGKTSLALRVAKSDSFRSSASTHGAEILTKKVPPAILRAKTMPGVVGELDLWDLGGQPEYNVIHQLFISDADAALILIDESTPHYSIPNLRYWNELLEKHAPHLAVKILVSARCDRGFRGLAKSQIDGLLKEYGFTSFVRTSAYSGEGVDKLASELFTAIDWGNFPISISPSSFTKLRSYLRSKREHEKPLVYFNELLDGIRSDVPTLNVSEGEIRTVVARLETQGLLYAIRTRKGPDAILLRPEYLVKYGSSLIAAARYDSGGTGELPERDVLKGDFRIAGFDRLRRAEETLLIGYVVELLVARGLCKRNAGILKFHLEAKPREIKCFLSYNRADKDSARVIAEKLLDNGIDIWLDTWEMLAGESITSGIEEGIARADAFIILLSQNSVTAEWVKEELRMAIRRRMKDSKFKLIPVLLSDCDVPGFLQDYIYVDYRDRQDREFDFLLNSLRDIRAKPTA